MEKSKGNESHNVYYSQDNYRIRIYRNDKKIFEKQAVMPRFQYYSLTRQIIDVLKIFIGKITQKKDEFEIYDKEFTDALNRASLFADLMNDLRRAEND